MTLEEAKNSDKLFLTPNEAAALLGTSAQTLRCTARQRPELLGFKFTFSGNHMKILREPFLRWLEVI